MHVLSDAPGSHVDVADLQALPGDGQGEHGFAESFLTHVYPQDPPVTSLSSTTAVIVGDIEC